MSTLQELISQQGFESVGTCAAAELTVHEEVRASCSEGNCHIYNTRWACPPACGSIYDYEKKMHEYAWCTVVQTVMQLEDEFDGETMMDALALQRERLYRLVDALDEAGLSQQVMVLAAGTCELCKKCTYPDAPCRFPHKQLVSMEAAGLLVSHTCDLAGVPYNHGPLTIAYSSCVLHN